MAPNEGPVADPVYGYHTLWVAEVPFIPAYMGKDEHGFEQGASHRLSKVLGRQVRFLYDLAQSRNHQATFELRMVCRPQAEGLSRIGIAFVGKVFHENEHISRQLARTLWDKFSAVFPLEAPFSYPLVPVGKEPGLAAPHTQSIDTWLEPLPFEQLTHPESIVEIRKYEDWPTIRSFGNVLNSQDYIPHRFIPALDYSAMARLFETLARQRETCMVAITLRPQLLTDQEALNLHKINDWYRRMAHGEVVVTSHVSEILKEFKTDVLQSYTHSRAEMGMSVYENLVKEQRSLLLVRLQVVGLPAPEDLIEALGSEIMANAGSAYPSRWTRITPTAQEQRWARFNLQWLEFARWGISPIIQRFPALIRLRQLATVAEAVGAFRLPIASQDGGLAGLDVRDEPFTLPNRSVAPHEQVIELGVIQDRGIPTGVPCSLPLSLFARPTLLLGDSDESRSLLLCTTLQQLQQYHVPWTLMLGSDSDARDELKVLGARHIKLDALSHEELLPLHPFFPPAGIAQARFLDGLLRVFMVAFSLDASTAIVMRRLLAEVYTKAGWIDQNRGHYLTMEQFVDAIESVTQQATLSTQVSDQLRAQCIMPLRDLAMTTAHLFQTTPSTTDMQLEPTIIELGWLGSDASRVVISGTLWHWFALAHAANAQAPLPLRGIVAFTSPRPFFTMASPQGRGEVSASPISSLLQPLSRDGVGTLLVDSRADLLEADVADKASVVFLTRCANMAAQERAGNLIGATTRQQARLHHLHAREAVIAPRNTPPVLIAL